jgi:DNA polymerase type B, organellar and viral
VLCNKDNLPYGFFEVDLETPSKQEWNQPILLKKHKMNSEGVRTIAPVGNWKGIYYSEELYNAINKISNHKFKTHRGFLFRKAYIFGNYVNTLFNLRIDNPPKSPLNVTAKLLLNSLYGRFGMNPEKANHIILSNENKIGTINSKDYIYIDNDIKDTIDFGNGKELVSYLPKKSLEKDASCMLIDEKVSEKSMLINVAIAAATTGLSRIYMSLFKINPKIKLYYSDTDSAFIDGNLEDIYPELVGTELGQLKPEYELDDAVFLAPKVYGGITSDGKSMVKAKGVKNIIPFDELKTLLNKGVKLQIPSEKRYRNLGAGNIQVKKKFII